mgnify:CR=1 FL=1|jgi:hypothetical protein
MSKSNATGLDGNPAFKSMDGSVTRIAGTIAGASVVQRIIGGVAGADYVLRCQVDTAAGERFVLTGVLPVRTA